MAASGSFASMASRALATSASSAIRMLSGWAESAPMARSAWDAERSSAGVSAVSLRIRASCHSHSASRRDTPGNSNTQSLSMARSVCTAVVQSSCSMARFAAHSRSAGSPMKKAAATSSAQSGRHSAMRLRRAFRPCSWLYSSSRMRCIRAVSSRTLRVDRSSWRSRWFTCFSTASRLYRVKIRSFCRRHRAQISSLSGFGRPHTHTHSPSCWLGKPTAASPATNLRLVSALETGSSLEIYSTLLDISRRHTALSLNHTLSIVTSALRAAGFGSQGTFIWKAECGRPFSARAR